MIYLVFLFVVIGSLLVFVACRSGFGDHLSTTDLTYSGACGMVGGLLAMAGAVMIGQFDNVKLIPSMRIWSPDTFGVAWAIGFISFLVFGFFAIVLFSATPAAYWLDNGGPQRVIVALKRRVRH